MTDFAVFAQQIIDELTKEGRKHTAGKKDFYESCLPFVIHIFTSISVTT